MLTSIWKLQSYLHNLGPFIESRGTWGGTWEYILDNQAERVQRVARISPAGADLECDGELWKRDKSVRSEELLLFVTNITNIQI